MSGPAQQEDVLRAHFPPSLPGQVPFISKLLCLRAQDAPGSSRPHIYLHTPKPSEER